MTAPKKKPVGRPKKKDIVEEVKEEVKKELENKRTVVNPPTHQIPFVNATNLKFIDISHENFRQYLYSNGAKIEILFPLRLSIDRTNIHRVFDSKGLTYYIPPNWIAVVTKPKPGSPNVTM